MYLSRYYFFVLLFITSTNAHYEHLGRDDLTKEDKLRVNLVTQIKYDLEKYEALSGGAGTSNAIPSINSFSFASANLDFEGKQKFQIGNGLFTKLWVSSPSSTKASDGLGPLFNARSCQRCHLKDGRGHPPQNKNDLKVSMLMQLSAHEKLLKNTDYVVPKPDPVYGFQLQDNAVAGINSEGTFTVDYTEKTIELNGGELVSLRIPHYNISNLNYGDLHENTKFSPRVAQQMIGMGLLEAIHENDIIKLSDPMDLDKDGISGKVSWIYDKSFSQKKLGRFGWKATNATVIEQSASAFFHDMGLSSKIKSDSFGDCTYKQTKCINAFHGDDGDYEVPNNFLEFVTFYAKNLAVPKRRDVSSKEVLAGKKIFFEAGCGNCHHPKFVTNRKAENKEHQFQLIWPYTDLLLHDMGPELSDNRPFGSASGSEWRTPPLWGIGLTELVSDHTFFLHDGRARNLKEAILWHGGEGAQSRDYFKNLSNDSREKLLKFLNSL